MKNKYRVTQIGDKSFYIEEKFLWFWILYYKYESSEYAIKRCKELENEYTYRNKIIFPDNTDG